MPKLKDYMASDLAAFFNQDEFAELHDIDGRQITAVVDRDVVRDYSRLLERRDGVYVGEIAVFVRSTDLPDRPVKGQHLRLDGELYLVTECAESAGVLEITLEANEA